MNIVPCGYYGPQLAGTVSATARRQTQRLVSARAIGGGIPHLRTYLGLHVRLFYATADFSISARSLIKQLSSSMQSSNCLSTRLQLCKY